MTPAPDQRAQVVYRRPPAEGPPPRAQSFRARTREIAPTLTPLILGFFVLLAVIFGLGWWTSRKMDDVGFIAKDIEIQHSARLTLLLNLRLAVTKLDNEARVRHDAEARRELVPPFDFRVNRARDEVKVLAQQLNKPPLPEEAAWAQFRNDLQAYLKASEDLKTYSLEGFTKFRTVDKELYDLFVVLGNEQVENYNRVQALQLQARRSVRLWNLIALLVGALVAAGTVWEVQRRFKETRRSMLETTRERTFTSQLLEGMVSAVAAIDEDDRIRSANAGFFKIFPQATIGASVLEPFGPEDAMKMLEAATATRVNRAAYRGRWMARVDDEERSFDVYSSPLAIDGNRGQIITLVDATEVAESERALRRTESLAAVGQATTQVAHEIRNPLGSIRLGVSMLRDSVNDPEALNTIELVERGINHLNKLVVDVTQFSRQKALERTTVDLSEALDRSIDLVSERIREKNSRIERQFLSDRIVGLWDADQLRQVFVNVIANAVDASPENGTVRISTELLRGAADGNGQRAKTFARVTVADRGKGMDKATRDRIFEPFFSTKKRGTGLGLAIVKQIVEQHGGAISVTSEPEKGSRFRIDLPLQ